MEDYLFSLGAGVLVGVIYSLLRIRSPAPPLVALVGLLGMLAGAQAIPVAKHWLGYAATASATASASTNGERRLVDSRTDISVSRTDRERMGNMETHL